MADADQKREEIRTVLARHVLAHGLGDTGLRRLAAVAGTSDRMLLYYFENKDALVRSVLERIADDFDAGFAAWLDSLPTQPGPALEVLWAALKASANADALRLWLDLSSRAGRGDRAIEHAVDRIRDGWVDRLATRFELPPDRARAVATLIMAAVDGQVVLFPTDLARGDAAIAELVRALDA